MSAMQEVDPDNIAFRLQIDAGGMVDWIASMDMLVDEARIHLEEDSFWVRAVDPANVGMVDTALDPGAFETYQPHGGIIGVSLDRLTDILGMADSGEIATLLLDEETRKLHVEFGGLEYTLALIDPDSIRQDPDIPDLDLTVEATLEGSDLSRAVTAADMVSDHISVALDESDRTLRFEAEGDTDDVELELTEDDLVDIDVGGDAGSLFSLDYLQDMVKPIDSDDEAVLEVGHEFPMKLHLDRESLSATYMLAPRIQSD